MNDLLQLKGAFSSRKNNRPTKVIANILKGVEISSGHLYALADGLHMVRARWESDTRLKGALVSVRYTRVVPKSKRISTLLGAKGLAPAESICGAKFRTSEIGVAHVFTHFVPLKALSDSEGWLTAAAEIVQNHFEGKIDCDKFLAVQKAGFPSEVNLSKSRFLSVLADASVLDSFGVDEMDLQVKGQALVTLFETGNDTRALLESYGVDVTGFAALDETTVLLGEAGVRDLCRKAPFLIAMQVRDMRELDKEFGGDSDVRPPVQTIVPHPTVEPTVGVIDTLFSKDVYFADWVDYHEMVDANIPVADDDYFHGTAVTSIIVDGPHLNPKIDDGCGRFRVRHFGVAAGGRFSSFGLLRKIEEIVAHNRDIKVWNLSLGSAMEIFENSISPEAAVLDRLQAEQDVVFVVSGTNVPHGREGEPMRIGSPADSLNSVVVNAVDFKGRPASYSRRGPVLHFFNKPDICYYGGDGNTADERMCVVGNDGFTWAVRGTSFAAPWIARKLAYLIHVSGFTREIAKALIVDAAAGWDVPADVRRKGYGVVPVKISEILSSRDDEIKFVLRGVSEAYETYTFDLPVPLVKGAFPYFAKSTLVYFPQCDRRQGVDYTVTEMDVHFGRVHLEEGKTANITSIDRNRQGEDDGSGIQEAKARSLFRKWDNVKHIHEILNPRARPRKAYENTKRWGLLIRSKDRRNAQERPHLAFGVVVTLREMNGINRIGEFISACSALGWIVNRYDAEVTQTVNLKAGETVEWE